MGGTNIRAAIAVVLVLFAPDYYSTADPQTVQLNHGCSQYNATNPASFVSDVNTTIAGLRSQVASSSFPINLTATASVPRAATPVYALFLCRGYLSNADCLACLTTATAFLRSTCGAANGARVIYDGCELRYESASFFDQGTTPGNAGICNGTATPGSSFSDAAGSLVQNLSIAVPRIPGFYAAASGGGAYGVAQCASTVDEQTCATCLATAYANIKVCPPVANGRAYDSGCFMRFSNAAFFPGNDTVDLSPFLPVPGGGGGSSNKGAIIGGVLGGVGGFLLVVLLLIYLWFRKSGKGGKDGILGAMELQGPARFQYRDLKSATKNFSEDNKLGEGGFGGVYKGLLGNGKIVAVKKLTVNQASRAKTSFQSEVKLISNVHHRNLVRLLGCSAKGPDLLLVYEYMSNNSLDRHLFGEGRGKLNWKQRFDIILGMARGLAYLHQEYHVCIIHRDIKSSNILLDEDFQPKIADFGLARLLPSDQTHLTTKFAGTLGYTAPEYAIHGQLSEKVDTYSYGVVVLEIISGRKSNDVNLEPLTQYLLEWAWKLYEEGISLDLVDETLDPNEYNPVEMKRIIEIALLCTQSTVAARPTMSEVVVMLLSQGGSLVQPTRPVFIDASSRVRGDTSSSNTSVSLSNATASVSLSAR